jgi:hypothetical protein
MPVPVCALLVCRFHILLIVSQLTSILCFSSEEENEPPPENYEELTKVGKLNAANKAAKNKLAVSSGFECCKHDADTNHRPCNWRTSE